MRVRSRIPIRAPLRVPLRVHGFPEAAENGSVGLDFTDLERHGQVSRYERRVIGDLNRFP